MVSKRGSGEEEQQNGNSGSMQKKRPRKSIYWQSHVIDSTLELKVCSAAMAWQSQGYPRIDFLRSLGLEGLAKVDWDRMWNVGCCSAKAPVRDFISNYNVDRNESTVDGKRIHLTPELISQRFQVPNNGFKIKYKCRCSNGPDLMGFFKEGAYSTEQGFSHEMLNDASLVPVFDFLAEEAELKCHTTHTSAYFLGVIERARQGTIIDWADHMYQKLVCRLKKLKEKSEKGQKVCFVGSALIAHLLCGHLENGHSTAPSTELALVSVTKTEAEFGSVVPATRTEAEVVSLAATTLDNMKSSSPAAAAAAVSVMSTTTSNSGCGGGVPIVEAIPLSTSHDPNIVFALPISPLTPEVSPASAGLPFSLPRSPTKTELRNKSGIYLPRLASALDEIYGLAQVQERSNREMKKLLNDCESDLKHHKEEVAMLTKSECGLKDENRRLMGRNTELENENERLSVNLEIHKKALLEAEKQMGELRADVTCLQKVASQVAEQKFSKELDELRVEVTGLRTELAAKSFSYNASIWEKIQGEVWKQARDVYSNLVNTIADLEGELEEYRKQSAVTVIPEVTQVTEAALVITEVAQATIQVSEEEEEEDEEEVKQASEEPKQVTEAELMQVTEATDVTEVEAMDVSEDVTVVTEAPVEAAAAAAPVEESAAATAIEAEAEAIEDAAAAAAATEEAVAEATEETMREELSATETTAAVEE